jgi:hypothetical protein
LNNLPHSWVLRRNVSDGGRSTEIRILDSLGCAIATLKDEPFGWFGLSVSAPNHGENHLVALQRLERVQLLRGMRIVSPTCTRCSVRLLEAIPPVKELS